MKVIRPIAMRDRQAFEDFAFSVGIGITSLPKNPTLLREKLMNSLTSFSGKEEPSRKEPNREEPVSRLYIFVLEDIKSNKLLGTCGIRVQMPDEDPTFFYRIEMESIASSLAEVPSAIKVLRPIRYQESLTEICGLYILPEFRKAGSGRLLSLSRFLFLATFPHLFPDSIIADMRGALDSNHEIFWENIGKHFFDVSLNQALDLANHNRKFISEILPKYPIYVPLLPKEVQLSIGQTHQNTKPALNLLKQEGFYFTDEVSVFDGGPKLAATKESIRACKESIKAEIVEILDQDSDDSDHIISNERLDFRACFGHIHQVDSQHVAITKNVAEALEVDLGSHIRFMNSHPNEPIDGEST